MGETRRDTRRLAPLAVFAFVLGPALVSAFGSAPARAAEGTAAPRIVGWSEEAWIGEAGGRAAAARLRLPAKLDTGADTSSIDARRWRVVARDGGPWVELDVGGGDRDARATRLVAPLVRWATVKRAGAPNERRPVVRLAVCVAGATGDAEFTVADRRGLEFRLLIGRAFLANRLIVDSAREGSADGACAAP